MWRRYFSKGVCSVHTYIHGEVASTLTSARYLKTALGLELEAAQSAQVTDQVAVVFPVCSHGKRGSSEQGQKADRTARYKDPGTHASTFLTACQVTLTIGSFRMSTALEYETEASHPKPRQLQNSSISVASFRPCPMAKVSSAPVCLFLQAHGEGEFGVHGVRVDGGGSPRCQCCYCPCRCTGRRPRFMEC